jgi:hypothetical protein
MHILALAVYLLSPDDIIHSKHIARNNYIPLIINVIGQSSWLLTQRSRGQFPVLPDFVNSSGSGTGSTQPL